MSLGDTEPPRLVAVEYDPFASPDLERVVSTTEPQREVWLADRLGREASLAFNESVSLRFGGALNVPALKSAVQRLVERHESLRATFSADGSDLCIASEFRLDVVETDLSQGAAAERDGWLEERRAAHVSEPFDLERGPLVRAEIVRLSPSDHELIVTVHHIVCDGWSFWVLVRDLASLYRLQVGAPEKPLPPADSFAEYAVATARSEQSEDHARHEQYWLERFSGGAPILDLPTDHMRPPTRTFASGREDYVLDPVLIADVKRVAAKHGTSLFASVLATFSVLLHRLSTQTQVVIGVPTAGQSVGGHDSLVGHCVNLLPVRVDLDPTQSFTELLSEVQSTMLDAFEHQQYTYGTLLKKLAISRDPSRLPLVSVMINIDQALGQEMARFPDVQASFTAIARRYENFELFINAAQIDGGLRLECQYNKGLYDVATVRRWLECVETLMRSWIADPAISVNRLPLLGAAELGRLQGLQPRGISYPSEMTVASLIESRIEGAGDRIALTFDEESWSYAQLERHANQIAHCLRARGVQRGCRVGICLDRSVPMVAALLGVLKAGGGYVPLDPAYPSERLRFMVEDADLTVLVSHSSLTSLLQFAPERTLLLDAQAAEIAAAPATRLPRDAQAAEPRSIAYLIYTSGSTGKPKGVQVPHQAVVNFLCSMQREPGLSAEDRLLAVTTISFDIHVLELWAPLTLGAQVVLASRETLLEGPALRALLASSQATCMQATPALWRLLIEAGWPGGTSFKALCGGEALPPDLAERLLERCGELWNMYGPTETTVWSTCWRVSNPRAGISIGRPIANTSVHILDEQRQLCPIGVPGEIYIGGDGVTLGYLNRPALNAERFLPDPYSDRPEARLYRTGDRGRWLANGTLEHLGRLDFQVKVRGFRVELGEIEANLTAHADITSAVVITREDEPGDVRLVAYLVPRDGHTPQERELRVHLKTSLPDYMIPQHFIAIEHIPLLSNGKADRNSLPSPRGVRSGETRDYVQPRNELERQVATAMAQALTLPDVSIHDDFFSLGGHSLLAARLTAQINKDLKVSLPLRAVFEAPTVARLANIVDAGAKAAPGEMVRIAHRGDQSRAPLSLMQQRVWFLEQLNPGRPTFNTPSAHRLLGTLNEQAFQRAFDMLVERQAALRTEIGTDGEGPVQIVRPHLQVQLLPAVDLSDLAPEARETEMMRQMRALNDRPFDLNTAPLFSARIFKLAPDEHVFFFMTHHIIWDGWSFDLLYQEMAQLYGALEAAQTPQLEPLEISYGDFSAWHRDWMNGSELGRQLAHWSSRLQPPLDPLELSTDWPRPPVMSGAGATEWITVEKTLAESLREIGARRGATIFMSLLTAFYVLLHRHSHQRDIIVGTPVRGRNSPSVENVMGFFVNVLPLRLQLAPETTFLQLLEQVREVVVDAFTYPDVPFEHLVHSLRVPRDESRPPIYQALFSYQDVRNRPTRWGNLSHGRVPPPQAGAAEDLALWFVENERGLVGGLKFNTDILSHESAQLIRDHYLRLVRAIVAHPETPIGELPVLADGEAERLARFNPAASRYERSAVIHELISLHAESTRTALVFGEERWSYAQLERHANQIAHCLRARGVQRGCRVGICLDRSVPMVAALLGVLKAGGGYVPLDPAYPSERLRFMVEDADLTVLVSHSSLTSLLQFAPERTLLLDAQAAEIAAAPATRLPRDAQAAEPRSIAYLIYTSGSTGKPKGVQVPHQAVVNFLCSMQREPGLSAEDRLLAVTTISFDIHVLELWAPLTLGAQVVLASRETLLEGPALRALLASSQATCMQATPALWRLLIEAGWPGGTSFKALCGGEALPPDLAERLLERCGELWNMYGPTETTVWSTCWRVSNPRAGISIGRPIANTSVHILDEQRQLCPIGVPGEIYIGGDGVTLGYLNRPALNAERFLPDPYSDRPEARLYRTGDRGRWLANGTLEHLGRLDFQVKVRGFRVELGEIEAALEEHESIKQAVVALRGTSSEDARIVAYATFQPGGSATSSELRRFLRKSLPEYMLPNVFVDLDDLPLTQNGKVDRLRLPPLADERHGSDDVFIAPRTAAEKAIAAVWQEMLGVQRVSVRDNFFELGGHSLLAARMVAHVAQTAGYALRLRSVIFETLEQIAAGAEQDIQGVGRPTTGT